MAPAALSRRLRWLAPAVAAGLVAAGAVVPRLADASEGVADLAPRTAAELLTAVSQARVDGLSGTVVATSRLGLPELPSSGRSGSALTLTDLLAGSTTAQVWKAGEDRSRVAVVDTPFAEYDVVRSGRDVWTYDSASKDVTHLVLPEHGRTAEPAPSGAATPQEAADAVLRLVDPSTAVSVGTAAEVAGRPAYELVLDPRDPGTLVRSVRVAVDGETSVPLRVQVFGTGQPEPAAEVAFTSVSFEEPDASVFRFVPPAGAQVQEKTLPSHDGDAPRASRDSAARPSSGGPEVLGQGWTSVVRLSGVTVPEQAEALVGQLSRRVEGGRVVESALLTVLLLDDGRALAGAVPVQRLVELAGQ